MRVWPGSIPRGVVSCTPGDLWSYTVNILRFNVDVDICSVAHYPVQASEANVVINSVSDSQTYVQMNRTDGCTDINVII